VHLIIISGTYTLGTNPLGEGSFRCRYLCLTKIQHSQETYIRNPRGDSKPQSQQASGRRPTSWTSRNPGSIM